MAWPRVQDNRILAALLSSLAALAWYALWLGEKTPFGHMLLHFHSGHHMPMAASGWTLALAFVVGWTLMTIAMMLPTSSPMILLFQRMVSARPGANGLVALLIVGYLWVWIAFGAVVYLLSRAVQSVVAGVPWAVEHAWVGGAVILLGAGLFQFSSLKYACLDKCRSPMSFLVERWRGARPAKEALRLGIDHGIYCVGCCWSLMLVMMAVGTSSLAWMLGLALVMAVEKNFSWGRRLSAPVGVALIAGAGVLILQA